MTDHRSQELLPLVEIPPRKFQYDPLQILHIKKTIHLAVGDDVLLSQLEQDIVDLPAFQRLRGIRQLGTVFLVYPTAVHTRFDHSLGTLGMAAGMIAAIRSNSHNEGDEGEISQEQEVLARLYALLHDITHVPFGHTIEDELDLFVRHDRNTPRILHFLGPTSAIGELLKQELGVSLYCRFLALCNWDPKADYQRLISSKSHNHFIDIGETIRGAFGEQALQEYWRIATAPPTASNLLDDAFVYDLVSNTVCADLLDYLARDSYFCGLDIGIKYRFLNFLYLGRDGDGGRRRVFVRLWKHGKPRPRRDTLTDLARLLEARYLLAERAYFHQAKLISGAMLGRALQEANEVGAITEEMLYAYSDDMLLHDLAASKNTTAAKLANCILERKLHKSFYTLSTDGIEAVQGQDHEDDTINRIDALVGSPKVRRDHENLLCEEINAAPGDVLIYASADRNMNMKLAEMKVLWKGRPVPLKEIDDRVLRPRLKQILDAHAMLWGLHVFVSKAVTAEQRELLELACKLLFETPIVGQARSKQAYYRKLVEQRILKRGLDTARLEGSVFECRDRVVDDLLVFQHDATAAWSKIIDDTITKHFRSA